MKDPTEIRENRSGIATSPELAAEMVKGTEQWSPFDTSAAMLFDELRSAAMKEAEPAGSMPPTAGLKEMARSALDALKGKNPAVLLDALGARLACERTGTRIYEALLVKVRTVGPQAGGPTVQDLSEIWNDELSHFQLVKDAIEQLGGDPTVMTPGANREGVAAIGPLQIASDPRLNVRESLHAALLIELADNDSWELLLRLAESLGQSALAKSFRTCLVTEEQHLKRVRGWVSALTERAATGDSSAATEKPTDDGRMTPVAA